MIVAVVLLAGATPGATDSAARQAFTSITYPGAVLTTVYGTRKGRLGQYQYGDGIRHGYVLDRAGSNPTSAGGLALMLIKGEKIGPGLRFPRAIRPFSRLNP